MAHPGTFAAPYRSNLRKPGFTPLSRASSLWNITLAIGLASKPGQDQFPSILVRLGVNPPPPRARRRAAHSWRASSFWNIAMRIGVGERRLPRCLPSGRGTARKPRSASQTPAGASSLWNITKREGADSLTRCLTDLIGEALFQE
jgi:hypothetical protein